MRRVTYSMGMSLDGYVVGPDGRFDWTEPDPDVFAAALEELGTLAVHFTGRRLYETMLYWEDPEVLPTLDGAEREWARQWTALPKVVFSRTLTQVQGTSRLAAGSLAEEVARWRDEPGEGDIALGGAELAAEAAALDLVDEYRPRIHPLFAGGGVPYYPQQARRVDLRLVAARTFACGVVELRQRVVRDEGGAGPGQA